MFLSMEILAGDLAQWHASAHVRDAEGSRQIRYVTPAGTLPLDDATALYAMRANELAGCASRAKDGTNLLCVGVLILDAPESDFDRALKDCAEAIAWYADGFTNLADAVERGDEEAMRRAAALLRYCLHDEPTQDADPSALAEQLNLLLHRNITSWQLLEDTIADWGWDLLDEYLCVTSTIPDGAFRSMLATVQPETTDKTPAQVYLPQEEYLVVARRHPRSPLACTRSQKKRALGRAIHSASCRISTTTASRPSPPCR